MPPSADGFLIGPHRPTLRSTLISIPLFGRSIHPLMLNLVHVQKTTYNSRDAINSRALRGNMNTAFFRVILLLAVSISVAASTNSPTPQQRRASFNDGWKFLNQPVDGAEEIDLNDSQWRDVRLPHDWAIEGPFDSKLNPHTGALPISGTGWYRKTFTLPAGLKGRFFTIEFDGAMSNAVVWINGTKLGERPYGYSSFAFDLTPYLHFGAEKNVLAVRLAPEEHSSRWYPGAGIYRNVWLTDTAPVHVAHWGTYVTTLQVSSAKANVDVKASIQNQLAQSSNIELRNTIVDASGRTVATTHMPSTIPANSTQTIPATLTIASPALWDVNRPYLYTLVSEVVEHGRVIDRYQTAFGVRTIEFDRTKGFLLNGKSLKLHGVCLHHDLGALGAAVNRRAIERQLQIMKAAGVNAIRTSHNPPAPELLEYADRLGLLVMDEAFDMWRIPKVPNGYSKYFDQWSERDIRDMIRRDRNHPSIIMWSIGNEIPDQQQADGWKEARRLTGFAHDEDPTRPTTSAFNEWRDAIRNKLADEVDLPRFQLPAHAIRQHHEGSSEVDHSRNRNGFMRQLSRNLSPPDREVPEARIAPAQQLRHHRAPVGVLPRCRIYLSGAIPQRPRPIRVDRFRLHW